MKTPRDIIDTLGAAQIAERLGLTEATVNNKRWAAAMPPAWFGGLERMALERGLLIPRDAFAWSRPDDGAAA